MMPTAEEFLKSYKYDFTKDNNTLLTSCMIEFAKLHVEAALKAQEDILISEFQEMRESGDTDMRTVIHKTKKILNAYPLDQIK